MENKIVVNIPVFLNGVLDKFPQGSLTTEKHVELATKYLVELAIDKYIHCLSSDNFTADEIQQILDDVEKDIADAPKVVLTQTEIEDFLRKLNKIAQKQFLTGLFRSQILLCRDNFDAIQNLMKELKWEKVEAD